MAVSSAPRASILVSITLIFFSMPRAEPAVGDRAWIGVNFGNDFSRDPLTPDEAMDALQRLGVSRIKLFTPSVDVLSAINASIPDAQVTVTLPNAALPRLARDLNVSFDVLAPLMPFAHIISFVAISNEPDALWPPKALRSLLQPAINNLNFGLRTLGFEDTKIIVPFTAALLSISYPPSASEFHYSWYPVLTPLLSFLDATGSPFVVNLYPWMAWVTMQDIIPWDYALGNASAPVVWDAGNRTYYSLFNAMYDAILAALARAGHPNLELAVGETGWPTAGGPGASPEAAAAFTNHLIRQVSSVKGTPRRPGHRLPVYLFEAFDELDKPTAPGLPWKVEPHWGLLYENGTSKYELDWYGGHQGVEASGPILTTSRTTSRLRKPGEGLW